MKFNQNVLKNLFTVGAVLGVAATAYFAAKDGDKITELENTIKDEISYYDNKKAKIVHVVRSTPRIVKTSWKPLVCVGATYACMAVSSKITAKQIAALTATCAYITRNRDFLEQKLKDVVGEEELTKIRKEFAAKEIVKEKIVYGGPTVEKSVFCIEDDDEGVLCFEDFFGRWFKCPKERVLEAEEQMRHLYSDSSVPYSCYNDFYGLLGITMTTAGGMWSWKKDEISDLHFTNTLLTPTEWGDYGPDGEYVNEDVYLINTDTWPSTPKKPLKEI